MGSINGKNQGAGAVGAERNFSCCTVRGRLIVFGASGAPRGRLILGGRLDVSGAEAYLADA